MASLQDIPLADDVDEGSDTQSKAKPANPLPRTQSEPFEDQEEKARLISQVLELQNTLDDLSQRVDSVKEESLKLRSENQVLGQYIENLMAASTVFQSTNPKAKPKFSTSLGQLFKR